MLGNLANKLKNMGRGQKGQLKSEFGKDAMQRRTTGGVRGDVAQKQAEAESKIRGNLP